jgi:peroxiredoxin (alkyl hydroperoxide reductase subunit C)
MSNGRSIAEFVRLLGALQTSDKYGVATPEAWCPGDQVIVPPPKTSAAAEERVTMGPSQGLDVTDWYFSKKSI